MKKNRKYLALLYSCVAMPIIVFLSYIIIIFLFSIFTYVMYRDFIFEVKDIYVACKLAPFGVPIGIAMWYLECRRLGIKIFGK